MSPAREALLKAGEVICRSMLEDSGESERNASLVEVALHIGRADGALAEQERMEAERVENLTKIAKAWAEENFLPHAPVVGEAVSGSDIVQRFAKGESVAALAESIGASTDVVEAVLRLAWSRKRREVAGE